jgi:hypothetical protein
MKLYRFIARYAGQRIMLDVNGASDDEAMSNFITKLREGQGNWCKEITYTPSKVFITYEEINDTAKSGIVDNKKDGAGIQMESALS